MTSKINNFSCSVKNREIVCGDNVRVFRCSNIISQANGYRMELSPFRCKECSKDLEEKMRMEDESDWHNGRSESEFHHMYIGG